MLNKVFNFEHICKAETDNWPDRAYESRSCDLAQYFRFVLVQT